MPQQISKKAENIKAETKKLEDMAKKKAQDIEKTEKAEEGNTKNEIHQISLELEKFKKNTKDAISGNAEDTGWNEQAVRVGERMRQFIEQKARVQHNLLLKADEATTELELKAKPIRKELPLVSDFSEQDRVQILAGIDKSIHKLKEKREMIEATESKLNRQMQVLMEYTPDPAEDKQTVMSKLQMSYDVVSGANDPDRARDDLLRQLTSIRQATDGNQMSNSSKKPAVQKPHTSQPPAPTPHSGHADHTRPLNPPAPVNLSQGTSNSPNPAVPPATARPPNAPTHTNSPPPQKPPLAKPK